jgi:DNA-binding transcriptional ArsR family regulator
MVQSLQTTGLDRTLSALADPKRRQLVEMLGERGEASITSIAERFAISLTGARKHVTVLEEAGLVRSVKRGRTRSCSLTGLPLRDAAAWFDTYGHMLAERLDRMGALVEEPKGGLP